MKDIEIFEEKDIDKQYVMEEKYKEEEYKEKVEKIINFAKKNDYYGMKFKEFMLDKSEYTKENECIIDNIIVNDFKVIRENFYKNNLKKIAKCLLTFIRWYGAYMIFCISGEIVDGKGTFYLNWLSYYVILYLLDIIFDVFTSEKIKDMKEIEQEKYKIKRFIIVILSIFVIDIILKKKIHIALFSINVSVIKDVFMILLVVYIAVYILSIFNHEIMSIIKKK